MLAIVQFYHPWPEHEMDEMEKKSARKAWNNKSDHARKFMHCLGSYTEDGASTISADLAFWGEWEPPSKIIELPKTRPNKDFLPRYIHEPILDEIKEPSPLPKRKRRSDPPRWQNTDPFVFGDSFKYGICRQNTHPELTELDPGSLILFGGRHAGQFQLDTVFVVERSIQGSLVYQDQSIDPLYKKISLNMAYPEEYPAMQRVFFGAKPNPDSIGGMYSFVPAKIWHSGDSGFPRINIPASDYIDLSLGTNVMPGNKVKLTPCKNLDEIKTYWLEIKELVKDSDCLEGVSFAMPKPKGEH